MRYRRSVYRKKRIKATVIVTVSAIALLTLLFAIIGNALGKKVDDSISKRKNTSVTSSEEHAELESVRAYPVPLSADGSTLSSRLAQASQKGYAAVCLELNSKNGSLLYSSPLSQALGRQDGSNSLRTLENIVKLCGENGLYSVGIIHLKEFNTDDDLARAAAIGYYSALASEALRAGMDDVLLYIEEMPSERYGELKTLADEVHRLCPTGHVGLSLPASAFSASDSDSIADSMWSAFDYLAADLSHPTEGEDAASYVSDKLGGMLYYLLRFNVRVIVPYTDDASLAERITAAVTSNGSENILIMPQ